MQKEEEAEEGWMMRRVYVLGLIFIILGCSNSNGAGRSTYEPPNSGSDGYLHAVSAISYTTVCNAVKSVNTGGANMLVGDWFDLGVFYRVYQAFIRFDLGAIAGEVVLSDSLMIWVLERGTEDFGVLTLADTRYDWYELSADDWLPGGAGVWNVDYSDVPASGWLVCDNIGPTPGEINPYNFDVTNLCITINPPTGKRYLKFATTDHATTAIRPYLIVNTVSGRHIFGPSVSHEPTANPMVEVSPTR